eukprot:6168257-Karenia_brevis.AAC.1
MDLARNAVLLQARQRIEVEAHNQWCTIEVTVPEGFVDPWQATIGNYIPNHVQNVNFPLDRRIYMFSLYFATNNFLHLGATPTPLGVDVSTSLDPHSMDIDPRDGMSEDNLYGSLQ